MKQKVEVNLTRKGMMGIDNKELDVFEEGLDRFGGNQVVAVVCTETFSYLQIMSMSRGKQQNGK
jgi:hypothetical protein